ncbi:uncharacterized protein LOC122008796 [Zingiber officinale]|uniref:uncharacterized protein LOC122008796 n=1 Tax=Zingiber officinale TaxID=94328 RepID=UPI001C4A955D|nr:uncharacterized protein LOC122008796 [Zingiber officinale]
MAVGDAYSAFMATWNKHAPRAAWRLPSLAKLAACGRKRIGAGGEGLLLRLVPCLGNRGNNSSNQNKKKKMKMMMRKVRSEISVEGEDEGVWRKTILMGEKCQPLDFSGAIHYDSAGRQLSTPRTPFRSPAISFAFYEEEGGKREEEVVNWKEL